MNDLERAREWLTRVSQYTSRLSPEESLAAEFAAVEKETSMNIDTSEDGVVKVLDLDTLELKGIARVRVSDREVRGSGRRLHLYDLAGDYSDITEVVLTVNGRPMSMAVPKQARS